MIAKKQAIEILAENPPPSGKEIAKIGDLNAKIYALETQLKLSHRPPVFNRRSTQVRIVQLESALTEKAASVAAAVPVVIETVADARPLSLDEQFAQRKAGKTESPEITRLTAQIEATPAGLTRDCLQAKLSLLKKI